MKCPPLHVFFVLFLATEFLFIATILQLKVAKRQLFEKVSLKRCIANQIHGFTIDYGKFILISDIPHLENIRSRDTFRPIARKQKDLMDYN